MARTAPVPNLPPIPGMCPSIAVMGGGGGSGPGGGSGAGDGSGDGSGDASGSGDQADADARGSDNCGNGAPGGCTECGTSMSAGDPVDSITGRVFSVPHLDLALPGPLALYLHRSYSSGARKRNSGLGFGWGHSLGWRVEVRRDELRVWKHDGTYTRFDLPPVGESVMGPPGWVLRRETWGFALDANSEAWHLFSAQTADATEWLLTGIQDRNGNRIELTYDDGRLVEIKDSAGRIIRVSSDRQGLITELQVPHPTAVDQYVAFARYEYDEAQNLSCYIDPEGARWSYHYDEGHRLTRQTDPNGLSFHYVYDAKHRCVETWGTYSAANRLGIHPECKLLFDKNTAVKGIFHTRIDYGADQYSEVVSAGRVQRLFGNKFGTLAKGVTGGRVSTNKYDALGNVVEHIDELEGITRWDRDTRGRALSFTDALGRRRQYERDAHGRITRFVDPAGGVTSCERDQRGNAILVTNQTGAAESLSWERGQIVRIGKANGGTERRSYDSQGNLSSVTEANGARTSALHDRLGRTIAVTDPCGNTTRYDHNLRGDIVAIHDADGTTTSYEYDGLRKPVRVITPTGTTSTEWGHLAKPLIYRKADGSEVQFLYDPDGRLLEVRNEKGEAHCYSYDVSGTVILERTFDGRTLRYARDARGRLTQVSDEVGWQVRFTWTAADELKQREYRDGSTEAYEYDKRGFVVEAAAGPVSTHFERDERGRILKETQTIDGIDYEVSSEWDGSGDRSVLATSLGHRMDFARDGVGDVTALAWGRMERLEYERNPAGQEQSRLLPGGGVVASSYDQLLQLAERSARRPDGNPAVELAYTYMGGFDGHLASATRSGSRTTYEFDPVGRLVGALRSATQSETFTYDATDNPFETGPNAAGRVVGLGNRLLRHGSSEFEYDSAGRLATRTDRDDQKVSTWSYQYNGKGLLERVTLPTGDEVRFSYDAFGRRVTKRLRSRSGVAQSETAFIWDERNLVHEIRRTADASGNPVVEERTFGYVEDSFAPALQQSTKVLSGVRSKGPLLHVLTDPQGAPESLVSNDGRLVSTFQRAAFGEATAHPAGSESTPLRAQGQYLDEETGLHYNGFRYYDPVSGRYISPDPLGLSGGYNQYAYGTNPIDWIDPLGLFGHSATASIIRGPLSAAAGLTDMGPTNFDSSQDATTSGLPYPENVMQSHTEQKVQRFARSNDIGPGDTLTIESTWDPRRPPCTRCRGAMNDLAHDTGATVIYRPGVGGASEWRANPNQPRRSGRRPPPARRPP